MRRDRLIAGQLLSTKACGSVTEPTADRCLLRAAGIRRVRLTQLEANIIPGLTAEPFCAVVLPPVTRIEQLPLARRDADPRAERGKRLIRAWKAGETCPTVLGQQVAYRSAYSGPAAALARGARLRSITLSHTHTADAARACFAHERPIRVLLAGLARRRRIGSLRLALVPDVALFGVWAVAGFEGTRRPE